jgi:hypothetical protein
MSEEVTINTALGKNIVVDADSFVLLTSKQKVDITPSDDYILQDNLSSLTNTFEHSDNLGFNGFAKHPNFKAVEYEVGKTPFLGDVTRIHRSTDRESAYLKYKYENLSSFRFTGYVSGDPNGCYKAYVSKDNKSYQYIRLKSTLVNSLSNGMKSYIFEPEKAITDQYNYLKIELMPRGHFNSTQLSFVQIGSKELPKLKPLKVDNLDITQLKGKETVLPSKVNVYYEGDISKNEGVVWQAGSDNKSHTGNVAGIPISANVRTIDEFNDTLLDTSKIFERLNVSIDQGNASVVYNDESRIVRSSEDMGYLTYNLQNMRNFESSFYLYDSKIVSKYITVKASVDNQNWVNVGLSVSPLSDKTNAWNKFLIKNRSPLPKEVKFLRFELTGGMTNWLQEVGEIKIYD